MCFSNFMKSVLTTVMIKSRNLKLAEIPSVKFISVWITKYEGPKLKFDCVKSKKNYRVLNKLINLK